MVYQDVSWSTLLRYKGAGGGERGEKGRGVQNREPADTLSPFVKISLKGTRAVCSIPIHCFFLSILRNATCLQHAYNMSSMPTT